MLPIMLNGSVIKYDEIVLSYWWHAVDHPDVFSPIFSVDSVLLDSDLERALTGFYFLARMKWKEK